MALISCQNLKLTYENHTVMENLTFSIDEGAYLCIVGENGSGKSTLVKALLGLKHPAAGTITFGDGLLQKEIGYLPQQTELQRDFPASVYEVVLSGCLNRRGLRPFFNTAEKELARKHMEQLRIADLKKQPYRALSGGQQQRVLLARAMCATKKLLLLDEPCAGLDPVATLELYQAVSDINRAGITVIMVSHDMQSAVKYASHILHLHNAPLFFGTAEDYKNSPLGRRFLRGEEND